MGKAGSDWRSRPLRACGYELTSRKRRLVLVGATRRFAVVSLVMFFSGDEPVPNLQGWDKPKNTVGCVGSIVTVTPLVLPPGTSYQTPPGCNPTLRLLV